LEWELDYKLKKMKKYTIVIGLFLALICFGSSLIVSCEKPGECIESTGDIVEQDVDLMMSATDSINRIYVEHGIELIVTEGPVVKVTVQTGSNLMENIEVRREGNVVYLKDKTTCNWVREFGMTKVYITTPKFILKPNEISALTAY
jgi:hypothetical protein